MDIYSLVCIIEQLKEIDKRKAVKLSKLFDKYLKEKSDKKKKEIGRNIRNFIFHIFLDCLDKKTKDELYNLCMSVTAEMCDLTEAEKSWYVNVEGATQLQSNNGKIEIVGSIPRTYGEGFVLSENATDEEKRFYSHNHGMLSYIASQLDRKEEIVTNYVLKDERIPREFTELLVDYIGFDRIKDNENKKAAAI